MKEYLKKLMEQNVAGVQSTLVGDKLVIHTKSVQGTETQRIPKAQNPGLALTEIIFSTDAASCFSKSRMLSHRALWL